MVYKKVRIFFKNNPNAMDYDSSVYESNYDNVALTVSGDYLIISLHGEDHVQTEVHHLSLVKNWVTYM